MAHVFVDSVSDFIEGRGLIDVDEPVVVGVSGGVDSMVCLSVLGRLGYDVRALHANYGLRPGADEDERLVREWCDEQSIPLSVVSLDANARAEARSESVQEAARRQRYEALAEHARTMGAPAVATGHHRDDQAETLLLNLFRGAGPEGLAGMRPSRPLREAPSVSLVRPLLDARRAEIEAFAEQEGLPWRTDPTNRSLAYDRGAVRTEILPRIEESFEGATDAIARAAGLVRAYVDQSLRPELDERMTRAYVDCEVGGWLSLEELTEAPPVWQTRLLLASLERTLPEAPQTRAFAEEVAGLIEAQVGRRVEVGGGTIWREREGLRFVPAEACDGRTGPVEVPWGEAVVVPQGMLLVERMEGTPDTLDSGSPFVAYADADQLGRTLQMRPWQDGDRIQPLGMEGSKTVSDVLTEAGVPSHRRSDVGVLCTDEHVAWVVGHRLDRRVRVRPDTEHVARLILRPREKPSDDCQSS